MPYFVHTVEDVVAYLRDFPGISEAARQALVNGYLTDLSERAEHFLERDPLEHESLRFWYEFSFIDGQRCYTFRFVADGSELASGVVLVLYVEHEVQDIPG